MFETTIAGSLPKPAWLAEPNKLWPPWRLEGAELAAAKRDATLLALKEQEDAGIDIVGDGEQVAPAFRARLPRAASTASISPTRSRWASAPTATKRWCRRWSAQLRLKGRVHATEAQLARAHTKRKLKFTLPGPMTIADTIADRHYGDRVKMAMAFAELLNQEARALAGRRRRRHPVRRAGLQRLHGRGRRTGASRRWSAPPRASPARPPCTSATATASRPTSTGRRRSATSGGNTRRSFPALAKSRIDQVSLECRNSQVPLELLTLLEGKDVLVGAIDVASDTVETPEEVAAVIGEAMKYVPKERIIACTNCGMAPMRRDIAYAKLRALGAGAALARKRFG